MQQGFLDNREVILRFIKTAIDDASELQELVTPLEKGTVLFRQGESLSNLYLILDGTVKLNHRRNDGTSLDLLTLEPGHFVGLVAFTTGNNSLTTATALENGKALCIRQENYETYVNEHPKLRSPIQQLMLSNMTDRFLKNVELESKMNALNQELEEEGIELKDAYQQLEESHQKLVHQEKMATLGELVAGFAHEVNNPAAALLRSTESLRENFSDLPDDDPRKKMLTLGLLSEPMSSTDVRERMKLVQKKFPWVKERFQIRRLSQMPEEAFQLINKHRKKIPIEVFIKQFESGKYIHNIQVASERIANLVKSLKSYSRQDHNQAEMIDIRTGIKDTILILSNRLKYMDMELDLREIPLTCGKLGELNQVWTNILVNACDAMDNGGKLLIRCKTEGEHKIVVEISDNGPGIHAEMLERIFEPNYTTKNQGAKFGLGLGLAISNEIIRQHGGFIRATNKDEGGAKFEIILPVRNC